MCPLPSYRTNGQVGSNRVFLPLFPLAEWLADNWWFLQSEAERPDTATSRGFDRRHNLRWAREGFVLPYLRFVSFGDGVEAGGNRLPSPMPASVSRERECNSAWQLPFQTFQDFVNAVVTRLDNMGLPGNHVARSVASNPKADLTSRSSVTLPRGLARIPTRLTLGWRDRSSTYPEEFVPNSSTIFCPSRTLGVERSDLRTDDCF